MKGTPMDDNKSKQWSRFAAGLTATLIILFAALFAGIFDARVNTVESSSLFLQTDLIGFTKEVYRVDEGNNDSRFATIDVTIDSPPASPATVEFITTDGTGKAGTDYVSTSGVLTFTKG